MNHARLPLSVVTVHLFLHCLRQSQEVHGRPPSLHSQPSFVAVNSRQHVEWREQVQQRRRCLCRAGSLPARLDGSDEADLRLRRWLNRPEVDLAPVSTEESTYVAEEKLIAAAEVENGDRRDRSTSPSVRSAASFAAVSSPVSISTLPSPIVTSSIAPTALQRTLDVCV